MTTEKSIPHQNGWVGFGWNENNWEFSLKQAHELLNETFPNVPTLLWRIDGHTILVNSAAMNQVHYTTYDQNSGVIGRKRYVTVFRCD